METKDNDKKKNKLLKTIMVVIITLILVFAIFHFGLDDGNKLVNFDADYRAPRETTNSYYEEWR